jgi:hypothetical protein
MQFKGLKYINRIRDASSDFRIFLKPFHLPLVVFTTFFFVSFENLNKSGRKLRGIGDVNFAFCPANRMSFSARKSAA